MLNHSYKWSLTRNPIYSLIEKSRLSLSMNGHICYRINGSQDIVLEHYRSGEYYRAINNANSKIETLVSPYSSISSKFYGVLSTSGDFNDDQRKLCRNQIFRELIEAITRVSKSPWISRFHIHNGKCWQRGIFPCDNSLY